MSADVSRVGRVPGFRPPRVVPRDTLRHLGAWLAVAAAILLLNLSLTFRNVWPTLAIRPTAEVSPDLAVALLGIVCLRWWAGRISARLLRGAAVAWVLLLAGRYVDVTTRALYGRDVNPYWDLRHVPSVGAMFATVAEPSQMALFLGTAVAAPVAVYAAARWCIGRVAQAADVPAARRLLGTAAGLLAALFARSRPAGGRWSACGSPIRSPPPTPARPTSCSTR